MTADTIWQRTDQAPPDTWVVGCWQSDTDQTKYSEIKYTDKFGWMNRQRYAVPPPTCWAPTPSRRGEQR